MDVLFRCFQLQPLEKPFLSRSVTLGFDIIGIPLIIIALVIIGLFGTKKIQQAQGAGVAVVILILFVFMGALIIYNGIKFAGGPIIDLALGVFSFGYAWVVLFAGALVVILAPHEGSLCTTKQ